MTLLAHILNWTLAFVTFGMLHAHEDDETPPLRGVFSVSAFTQTNELWIQWIDSFRSHSKLRITAWSDLTRISNTNYKHSRLPNYYIHHHYERDRGRSRSSVRPTLHSKWKASSTQQKFGLQSPIPLPTSRTKRRLCGSLQSAVSVRCIRCCIRCDGMCRDVCQLRRCQLPIEASRIQLSVQFTGMSLFVRSWFIDWIQRSTLQLDELGYQDHKGCWTDFRPCRWETRRLLLFTYFIELILQCGQLEGYPRIIRSWVGTMELKLSHRSESLNHCERVNLVSNTNHHLVG